jgi:hypothetical protein
MTRVVNWFMGVCGRERGSVSGAALELYSSELLLRNSSEADDDVSGRNTSTIKSVVKIGDEE